MVKCWIEAAKTGKGQFNNPTLRSTLRKLLKYLARLLERSFVSRLYVFTRFLEFIYFWPNPKVVLELSFLFYENIRLAERWIVLFELMRLK